MSETTFKKGNRVRHVVKGDGTFNEYCATPVGWAYVAWDKEGFLSSAVPLSELELIPAPNVTEMQKLWAAIAELQARVATLEAVAGRPRVAPFDPNDPDDVMMVEMTAAFEAHGPLTFTAVETPAPAAKAVAPVKLTPAKLRISRQMRHALEVYAEPQYIVDGLTIETVDGHYVGMMDRRIQQSMCKRGFIADSSEITHKRTFAITDLGRAALKAVSS